MYTRVTGVLLTLVVVSASALHGAEPGEEVPSRKHIPIEDTGGQAPHVKPESLPGSAVSPPLSKMPPKGLKPAKRRAPRPNEHISPDSGGRQPR
jgi:hypothetical protein